MVLNLKLFSTFKTHVWTDIQSARPQVIHEPTLELDVQEVRVVWAVNLHLGQQTEKDQDQLIFRDGFGDLVLFLEKLN